MAPADPESRAQKSRTPCSAARCLGGAAATRCRLSVNGMNVSPTSCITYRRVRLCCRYVDGETSSRLCRIAGGNWSISSCARSRVVPSISSRTSARSSSVVAPSSSAISTTSSVRCSGCHGRTTPVDLDRSRRNVQQQTGRVVIAAKAVDEPHPVLQIGLARRRQCSARPPPRARHSQPALDPRRAGSPACRRTLASHPLRQTSGAAASSPDCIGQHDHDAESRQTLGKAHRQIAARQIADAQQQHDGAVLVALRPDEKSRPRSSRPRS